MSDADSPSYRYPGTRPFDDTEADQRIFFGRELEADEMFHRILTTNLLVVYGQSGLGKTSLLRAGVFPKLRDKNLLPLEVRINRPERDPVTTFTSTLPSACERQGVDYTPGGGGGLWELFKTAVFWREQTLQVPVIVLDQFEELFTLHSESTRRALVKQLGELLSSELPEHLSARLAAGESLPYSSYPPNVKVVLSLREEYLGELETLSDEIPRILDQRFRLAPMTRKTARRAIVEPADLAGDELATKPFHYSKAALDEMLGFLVNDAGQIEPVTLQLLCSHLERTIVEAKGPTRDGVYEVRSADLGGVAGMRSLLQRFYRDTIAAIPGWLNRRRARRLCDESLLSPDGRRVMLEESQILSRHKLDPAVLSTLVDARVLRREPHLDSYYYEISHDSLVKSVLDMRPWRMSRRAKFGLLSAAGSSLTFVLLFLGMVQNNRKLEASNEQLFAQQEELEAEKRRVDETLVHLERLREATETLVWYSRREVTDPNAKKALAKVIINGFPPESALHYTPQTHNMISVAYQYLGDSEYHDLKYPEALASYEASYAEMNLAVEKSGVLSLGDELIFKKNSIILLAKLGICRYQTGDRDGASAAYREALSALQSLSLDEIADFDIRGQVEVKAPDEAEYDDLFGDLQTQPPISDGDRAAVSNSVKKGEILLELASMILDSGDMQNTQVVLAATKEHAQGAIAKLGSSGLAEGEIREHANILLSAQLTSAQTYGRQGQREESYRELNAAETTIERHFSSDDQLTVNFFGIAGNLALSQGDYDRAQEFFAKHMAVAEALVAEVLEKGGDILVFDTLAWSYIYQGDLDQVQGRLRKANDSFDEAQQLMSATLELRPQNLNLQYTLGAAEQRRGAILLRVGDWDGSSAAYVHGYEIFSELEQANPSQSNRRGAMVFLVGMVELELRGSDMGLPLSVHAAVVDSSSYGLSQLRRSWAPERANELIEEATKLAYELDETGDSEHEEMVDSDTHGTVEAHQDHAAVHLLNGRKLILDGDLDGALAQLKEGREIYEYVYAQLSGDLDAVKAVARADLSLGVVHALRGELDEATAAYAAAHEALSRILAQHPHDLDLHRLLCESLDGRGDMLSATDPEGARALYEQALEIREKNVVEEDLFSQLELAASYQRLGRDPDAFEVLLELELEERIPPLLAGWRESLASEL